VCGTDEGRRVPESHTVASESPQLVAAAAADDIEPSLLTFGREDIVASLAAAAAAAAAEEVHPGTGLVAAAAERQLGFEYQTNGKAAAWVYSVRCKTQ
jgi:hypothetical protein